jgi:hypothetical protein
MFKNAEYRMSMQQSLGMYKEMSSNLLLTGSSSSSTDGGGGDSYNSDDDYDTILDEEDPLLSGRIKGKIKVHYDGARNGAADSSSTTKKSSGSDGDAAAAAPAPGGGTDNSLNDDDDSGGGGFEIEVDASAYLAELRNEVKQLRDELTSSRQSKEAAVQQDLLLYIRTLPAQELKALTNTMSQDVLDCMKGLVQAVLAGIGDGQIGPDTVTEQSGEAMAQLCMWQLAVGYNLRELEVREQMKKNLSMLIGDPTGVSTVSGSAPDRQDGTSNDDDSTPGAFE